MSIEIGIMVLMCALAAAGLTAAWYYYDECKHWRESYEDIEREYRAESHIWHNRIAELERQARWRVETSSSFSIPQLDELRNGKAGKVKGTHDCYVSSSVVVAAESILRPKVILPQGADCKLLCYTATGALIAGHGS